MSSLVHNDPMAIHSARVQNTLVDATDLLNYQQAVTRAQLEALGRLTGVAAFEVARSLATADLIRAGRERVMSPKERAAYNQLDTEFLMRVSEIMHLYSEQVIRVGLPHVRQ